MSITTTCPCGKRFRAKDEAVGKRVKCPSCGQVFQVQPEVTLVDEAPQENPASDLIRVVDSEQRVCPSCKAPLSANDVICISCGFQVQTGNSFVTDTPGSGPPRAHPKSGFGGLRAKVVIPLGIVCLGVIAAAIVWFYFLNKDDKTKQSQNDETQKEQSRASLTDRREVDTRSSAPPLPPILEIQKNDYRNSYRDRTGGNRDLWANLADKPRFPSTTGETILLRYKWNNGQVFSLTMDMDMNIDTQVANQKIKIPISMLMAARCNVTSVASSGDAAITVTFTRIKMNSSLPTGAMSFDSADGRPVSQPELKHLAVMVDKPIYAKVSPLGELRESDIHVLTDALRKAGGAAMLAEIEKTTNQLMQNSFIQLSEDPVRANDIYDAGSIVEPLQGMGEMQTDIRYKILSVSRDKKLALLQPLMDLKIKPANPGRGGVKLKSNSFDGWILFDLEQGNIMRSAVTMTMDLSMSQQGMDIQTQTEMIMSYLTEYE